MDSTILTYESNKDDGRWVDIITPDEPTATDDLYPFVIDAASWTRLADGVVPDRVGKPETILDTADRTPEEVMDDLESSGSTWVTYTFHNPSTDTEQLKRTYLKLRDGLVFGSGYYLIDSRVQATTYGQVLEYNNKGADATFANLGVIPAEPVPTYVFVVEPTTGTIQAQNVDPALLGDVSDWDAISSTCRWTTSSTRSNGVPASGSTTNWQTLLPGTYKTSAPGWSSMTGWCSVQVTTWTQAIPDDAIDPIRN